MEEVIARDRGARGRPSRPRGRSSARAAASIALALCALAASPQDADRLYPLVSAATVYLRHEVLMDPSLCRNPDLVRKWEAERRTSFFGSYYPLSSGSGFLLDDEGLLLTNRHVIALGDLAAARSRAAEGAAYSVEQYASSTFTTEQKRLLKLDLYAMLTKGAYRFSATIDGQTIEEVSKLAVAGKDEPDIAVLRLPGIQGKSGLRLAAPELIAPKLVGQEVYSFGFPLEPDFNAAVVTMNKGNVSAIRNNDLGVQHSASISPGNSGGPLVDPSGLVLGMNAAVMKEGNNMYLAVGADRIRDFLAKRGIVVATGQPEAALIGASRPAGKEKVAAMVKLRAPAPGESAAEASDSGAIGVSSRISVEGEKGAAVFLDGQKIGQSPMIVLMSKPSATIAVRSPRGAFLARLKLDSSLRGATSLPAEPRKTGDLSVSAGAASAVAYLDGAELGKLGSGPFRGLPAGVHKLELVSQDAYSSQDIEIKPDALAEAKAELRPVGRLEIRVPADFTTTVSGGAYNMTLTGSASLPNLPAGEYSISTTSADSPVFSSTFSLQKGSLAAWEPCTFGFLSLTVSPAGSQCLIGSDRTIAADGSSEALSPGSYSATIRHSGFRDKELSFTILPGKRTRTTASLTEMVRGSLILPRVGCPVEIKTQGMTIKGRQGADGTVIYTGLPCGSSIVISFSSPAAKATNLPEQKLTLTEGETRKLELPAGRFSLPWIPEGSVVSIGSSERAELESEKAEGFLSPPLVPGEYVVGIKGGPKGTDCSFSTIIVSGETKEAEAYRGEMLGNLGYEKSAEEKDLSHRRSKSRIGVGCLVAGAVGAIGATTFYFLGRRAKSDYDEALTSDDAADKWDKVQGYQGWFYASAGVGAAGFLASAILLPGRSNADALRSSMDKLDEGIKALGGQQR